MTITHNNEISVDVLLDEMEFNWLIAHLTEQAHTDMTFTEHYSNIREEIKEYTRFNAKERTCKMTIPFDQLSFISTLFVNSAGIAHMDDYIPEFVFDDCI